ncbi:hypothetical protein BH11CYA1_BH11CYA1_33640 [soil metagenome]
MATFTKLALCGHRQVVLCSDATTATCIQVVACAICNEEEPERMHQEKPVARPRLRKVDKFADESLEISNAIKTATALPVQDHDLLGIDPVENMAIAFPTGSAMFEGFQLSTLHAVLVHLKIAGVPIIKTTEENEETKVFVKASRFLVQSALRNKVTNLRFFIERELS